MMAITQEHIDNARLWREMHTAQTDRLIAQAVESYAPVMTYDILRPKMWTGGHWKWFVENHEPPRGAGP